MANYSNPLLRGWITYYGQYTPPALAPILNYVVNNYVNTTLRAWMMRKFKRYADRKARAGHFLERLARARPNLFIHWKLGMRGSFA